MPAPSVATLETMRRRRHGLVPTYSSALSTPSPRQLMPHLPDVPTFFVDNLLDLTPRRIEGVAQRHVDVLVMLPVGDDLGVPGHANVDADFKSSTSPFTATRQLVMRGWKRSRPATFSRMRASRASERAMSAGQRAITGGHEIAIIFGENRRHRKC